MALIGFALLGYVSRAVWRAQHVLQSTSDQIAALRGIPLTIVPLPDRFGSPFEHSFDTTDYRGVTSFGGDLFLCGRSSLIRRGATGEIKQTWRVGEHLPPFPLMGLAVRHGIGVPELWIATDGAGVLIYDGQQMRQLLPSSQGQRKISAILPLRNGQVILGTPAAGVYTTNGKRLDLLHAQFSQAKVSALAGDEDELWIGTRDSGAWMWRAGTATHFSAELPDPQVLSIYRSEAATWIGTAVGIAEFVDGRFQRTLAEGIFAQSLLAHSGTLLIGTLEQGILSVSLERHRVVRNTRTKLPNVVAFDNTSGEPIAISPSALVRIEANETLDATPKFTLSSAHVSALHIDSQYRLWIGYFDRGLDILEQRTSDRRTHLESDLLFCVNRIKEDPASDSIAVATANGLALFDAATELRQTLNRANGLIADHVTDLLFRTSAESSPRLAVATPSGISFVEGGSITSVSAFQGLVNNHVYTLAERDGTLIAGTLGGMSLLHNGFVQASYNTANSSLHQNWITASATAAGDLFLGTYGSGVIRVGGDSTITSFREFARERVEINPNALLSTKRSIYAGTAAQGLAVLRLGDSRWHFIREGLPSLNVTALAAHKGNLYVGTDNGLVTAPEERLAP